MPVIEIWKHYEYGDLSKRLQRKLHPEMRIIKHNFRIWVNDEVLRKIFRYNKIEEFIYNFMKQKGFENIEGRYSLFLVLGGRKKELLWYGKVNEKIF